jgi:serine/threonine protein kinase
VDPGLVVAGKYHVVQLLAEGGMGAVYDAIHAKTGRRVALKLIHEHALSKGPKAIRRFEREAKAAGAIDSSHVVQVLDAGEDDASGMPFLVMEYLEGEDLRRVLARGPISEARALAIALETCRGLVAAHAADVVHRDLKPANLFLAETNDGRRVVKILDFGIAKLVEDDTATGALTTTGDLVGSPLYMSPEQLASPGDVDHRSDLWSLGVVLYEMLSGSVPTADVHAIGARVYAICHVPAASLTERVAGIRPEIAAVVARALALDPAARFASAQEMLAALRAVQSAKTPAPVAVRRRTWAIAGAALTCVAMSVAVAIGVRTSRDAPSVASPVVEGPVATSRPAVAASPLETSSAAPSTVSSTAAGTTASPSAGAEKAAPNARATVGVPDARPRARVAQPARVDTTGRDHL